MALTPPIDPMLARPMDQLPASTALPGGVVFEPKWDGYRLLIWTGAAHAHLQSRNAKDFTGAFPEISRAAAELEEDLVLDGEVVIAREGRLDFSALQRRINVRPERAAALAASEPAYVAIFDMLQRGRREMLEWPYRKRRAELEALFDHYNLKAPWSLTPTTTDRDRVEEWFTLWAAVGVEGVVAKGRAQPYRPGRREWIKVRSKDTAEALIGAVTGTLARPDTALLGRYDAEGELRLVARSTPLSPAVRSELAAVLVAAGRGHPWQGARFSSGWGSRDPLDFTCVHVDHVAEFEGDVAVDQGRYRHPVRISRLRADMSTDQVPLFSP